MIFSNYITFLIKTPSRLCSGRAFSDKSDKFDKI